MKTPLFDHQSSAFSAGTRRGLLQWLPWLSLTGGISAFRLSDASAKKKHKKDKSQTCYRQCSLARVPWHGVQGGLGLRFEGAERAIWQITEDTT